MDKKTIISIIKRVLFGVFLLAMIGVVIFIIKKYEIEGEKNLPYSLEKILIVSNVDGKRNEDAENIWNISLSEYNDVYVYIKNDENISEDVTIKDITLDNFKVTSKAKKGDLKLYRPTGELNNLYTYSEQSYLENNIVFQGSKIDDLKNLEIGNKGGVMAFRTSLENLGNYTSNEDTEIVYNGSLLQKVGVNLEDIKFSMQMDITIQTSENVSFKGTINLDFPAGDIVTNGSSNIEITDFSNIVFKRIQK